MKKGILNLRAALFLFLALNLQPAIAQTTAFTYQGRLRNGGTAANGSYDFRFTLYNTNVTGFAVAGPITNNTMTVSNGFFSTVVDFGSKMFTGQPRWLDVSVSPAGSNTFTEQIPRQPIISISHTMPTTDTSAVASASPVSDTNLSGTMALTSLPTTVMTNGATNVNISANISINAGSLTNINPLSANSTAVITQAGGGNFNVASAPAVGASPFCVTAADVNGDGKMDLISANVSANTLTILTNNGGGGFAIAASPAVGRRPYFVAAADVNGDGKVDLICANEESSTLTVLTNDGVGGFAIAASPVVGNYPIFVTAADVNGDGWVDLVSANSGANTLTVLTNNGSGGFVIAGSPAVGSLPCSVAAADVNGDGKVDLICANEFANTLTILTNNGSGGFVTASATVVGSYPYSITARDVNGDGRVDLICANEGADTLTVLTNNGSGGFVIAASPAVGGGPASVMTADVNGDGKVDLICANEFANTLTILTNNGGGRFVIAASLAVGNGPYCVIATDVNGDGRVDLISANVGANTLTVLTNYAVFNSTAHDSPAFAGNGNGLSPANLGNIISFIPTIGDGTNDFATSAAQGFYTKVGNLMFVQIWVKWSGKGSAMTGAPVVISLPLAGSSQRSMFTPGYVSGVTFSNQLVAIASDGVTNMNLSSLISGGDPTPVLVSGCATNGEIQLSGLYQP